jgi:hypothetical protein
VGATSAEYFKDIFFFCSIYLYVCERERDSDVSSYFGCTDCVAIVMSPCTLAWLAALLSCAGKTVEFLSNILRR